MSEFCNSKSQFKLLVMYVHLFIKDENSGNPIPIYDWGGGQEESSFSVQKKTPTTSQSNTIEIIRMKRKKISSTQINHTIQWYLLQLSKCHLTSSNFKNSLPQTNIISRKSQWFALFSIRKKSNNNNNTQHTTRAI